MSHYIILTAAHCEDLPECTFRVRADRIDWMSDRHTREDKYYTAVSVNGTELHVEEPVHVILTYIKNPGAPLQSEETYVRNPFFLDYEKKYGKEEGRRRFAEVMHYPC